MVVLILQPPQVGDLGPEVAVLLLELPEPRQLPLEHGILVVQVLERPQLAPEVAILLLEGQQRRVLELEHIAMLDLAVEQAELVLEGGVLIEEHVGLLPELDMVVVHLPQGAQLHLHVVVVLPQVLQLPLQELGVVREQHVLLRKHLQLGLQLHNPLLVQLAVRCGAELPNRQHRFANQRAEVGSRRPIPDDPCLQGRTHVPGDRRPEILWLTLRKRPVPRSPLDRLLNPAVAQEDPAGSSDALLPD